MARFSHINAYIDIATVDISGESNTCTLDIDIDISEITSFSEAWAEYVENGASAKLSVAGFTDQDPGEVEDTLFAMIGAGEQALIYRPQGVATGYEYTGNCFLDSFQVGGARSGGCPFSAVFIINGTLSRTAV